MENTQVLNLLEVFQICDSTFPIGTFNHSFGMENYLAERTIKNGDQFAEWINNYYKSSFKFGEGLLIFLVYKALDEGNIDAIVSYDNIMTASTVATETRKGTIVIAKQMGMLMDALYGDSVPNLNEYKAKISEKKAHGHPAIMFATYAHFKGIPLEQAYMMYGYSVGSTLVQNAVRAVPLGQNNGQVILHGLITQIASLYKETMDEGLDEYYLGANSPGVELAQIRHETQESRLFMS